VFHWGHMPNVVPLVRVMRGGALESLHRGAFVLLEAGAPPREAGNPDLHTFYRSASKPLQTLVVITSGAADAFGFDDAELALMAGSHNAEPSHLEVVASVLEKAGLRPDDLRCGAHWSIHPATARTQHREREEPLAIWSNCSGKHAGMLAAAKHLGAPLDSYLEPDHPVQHQIRAHIAAFAGLTVESVHVAVDGCGAPTFAAPLRSVAQSVLHMGCPDGLPADLAEAAQRVTQAMLAQPFMVSGTDRFDFILADATAADIAVKAGAEGVIGLVVPSRKLALAAKVEGGNDRGYKVLVTELLRRRGVITDAEAEEIGRRTGLPAIRNHGGDEIGHLEFCL